MTRRRVQLVCAAALVICCGAGLLMRSYRMHHNTIEIRYASGEIARVGDRVDDNGQDAVVVKVLSSPESAELVDEDGIVQKVTQEPGLELEWDIGLPVFRPITSERWEGIKLKGRAGGA